MPSGADHGRDFKHPGNMMKRSSIVYAESTINTVREPLVALEQDLRVAKVSRSFYDFFMVSPQETSRYLEANKSVCQIIGYSKEEIEKMSIRDLLAEESLEDGLVHFMK